jgi:hypothetical protein
LALPPEDAAAGEGQPQNQMLLENPETKKKKVKYRVIEKRKLRRDEKEKKHYEPCEARADLRRRLS